MNIILYNNASPMNKSVKDITEVATLSGYLREGTSLVNPHIMIEQANLPTFNYAKIPDFNNRYYFVESIINVSKNLWNIVLHCDVLSTYWNSIKEAECIVCRSENNRIDDLIDNEVWATADSLYSTIEFPNHPFENNSDGIRRYVLLIVGAGSAETSSSYQLPFSVSGQSITGIRAISANGISWDYSNSCFWIPNNFTQTWTFQILHILHTGVLTWKNATAVNQGGTTWNITIS